MRLIDGTKLQKDICRDLDISVVTDDFYKGASYVLDKVRRAKRVETKPKRLGHWEWFEEWSESNTDHYAECECAGWKCSVCDEPLADIVGGYWDDMYDIPKLNYCPNCGAKMEDNECHA